MKYLIGLSLAALPAIPFSSAGIGTMPPKGLCFDCTPEELRAIVEFMLKSSE